MSIPLSELLRAAMRVDANINRELEQKELSQAIAKLSNLQDEVTIDLPQLDLNLKIDDSPVIDHTASTEPLAALFPPTGDEDETDTALEALKNGTDQNGNGQGFQGGDQEPLKSEGEQSQSVEVLDQGQGEEVTQSAAAPVVTSPWETPEASAPKIPAKPKAK